MSERGFDERGFSERGFSHELRAILMAPPSDEAARSHLSSMLAASRAQDQPITTPHPGDLLTRARSLALKFTVATSGLLAATTGLAYAGVDIPGTAPVAVVEAVLPVDLPNQDGARSDEVHAVQSAMPKGGCEYGQAVSDAANGDHGSDKTHDPCSKASKSPEPSPSLTDADEPKKPKKVKAPKEPKEPKENPSDGNKAEAEGKADEAPNGPKEPKPDKTQEPKENPSDGNKAEAEGNSEGHSKADEAPRGPKEPKPEKTKEPKDTST